MIESLVLTLPLGLGEFLRFHSQFCARLRSSGAAPTVGRIFSGFPSMQKEKGAARALSRNPPGAAQPQGNAEEA